jgi:hypothetical protein
VKLKIFVSDLEPKPSGTGTNRNGPKKEDQQGEKGQITAKQSLFRIQSF